MEAHGGSYDKYDNSIIDDDGATPAKEESEDDSKNLYNGRPNYHKKAKKEFVDNLPSEDEPESDEDAVDGYLSDAGDDTRLRKQDAQREKLNSKMNHRNSRQ